MFSLVEISPVVGRKRRKCVKLYNNNTNTMTMTDEHFYLIYLETIIFVRTLKASQ